MRCGDACYSLPTKAEDGVDSQGGRGRGIGWAIPLSYDKWLQYVSQPGRTSLIPGISKSGFHSSLTNNLAPNTFCLQDILLLRITVQGEPLSSAMFSSAPSMVPPSVQKQGLPCLRGPLVS